MQTTMQTQGLTDTVVITQMIPHHTDDSVCYVRWTPKGAFKHVCWTRASSYRL